MKAAHLVKSVSAAFVASVIIVGASVSDADAAVYVLDVNSVPGTPSVFHMVTTNESVPNVFSLTGSIGNYAGGPGGGNGVKKTWAQFSIPVLPGENIISAVLNTHVVSNIGTAPGAGVRYTSDDVWNPEVSVGDYPTQTSVGVAPEGQIANSPNFVPGDYATDITSFLSEAGEGEGQPLSMSINYQGGGIRGALLGYDPIIEPGEVAAVRLTLTTEVIPEPASLGLLLGGSLLALRRRR